MDMIYNKLRENGYKEIDSAKEELDCYNMLMQGNEVASPEKIGYILISLILKNLKEHRPLDVHLKCFIRIFNERFNKKITYKNMMATLKASIGKNIIYSGYSNGKRILRKGILEKVEDFNAITVAEDRVPFIGYNAAISVIYDDFGHTIYSNSRIGNYYEVTDFSQIERLKEETFGVNYDETLKKVYL